MNISNYIQRIDFKNHSSEERSMRDFGFINYSRKITLFIKEKHNAYGISNNNLITNVGCLITNISSYEKDKKIFHNKTVYLCDLDYPSFLKTTDVKKNIFNCIGECEANPLYAFSNNVVEKSDGSYIDLGLSLIDLSIHDQSSFSIINFSTAEQTPLYKEVVYGNNYNPRFYSRLDNLENDPNRKVKIDEIVDDKTKLLFNVCNSDPLVTLKNKENNIEKTGIFIDKMTITLNDYMAEFFSNYLFLSFDNIEFVYDTRQTPNLNITKLTTFCKFNNNINDYFIDELLNDIKEKMECLKTKIGSDFYLITRISDQFMICDFHVFDTNREIMISKPLYRQYCEYAIDSEQVLNDIEYNGEIAKLDYIDKSIEQLGFTKDVTGAISLIEDATRKLTMFIDENKNNIRSMIGESTKTKLIEGDVKCQNE